MHYLFCVLDLQGGISFRVGAGFDPSPLLISLVPHRCERIAPGSLLDPTMVSVTRCELSRPKWFSLCLAGVMGECVMLSIGIRLYSLPLVN